ncbi:MAG TPA: aldo/keto reductase [Jatrophihabitans sp.]|jgi:NDP-hexose 2,3-enoyl reductase|nr:aldo/keto reductase [Jatrophihabitans sp.]
MAAPGSAARDSASGESAAPESASGESATQESAAQDWLYTHLGRTGLEVSRLILGTVNFGGRVEEPEAGRLLDHALARGINVVDTANMYGWRVHKGHTEEMIGRWLAARPGRREEVVLATKVGNEMAPGRNQGGLSARHVVAACEASLRRLRTDWIDLYQMHRVDPSVGWDELWQAMELLVSQGKVRYVGSSNFAGWNLAAAQEAAARRHFLGIVSEQCVYNLVTRHAELEVIPAARAYGIGVLVWSPLHGGLLSGVLAKLRAGTAVKSAQGRSATALERHRPAIVAYERFCADLGREPAEVALAWLASRPGVTALVIGPRTADQLDSALAALTAGLSVDELSRLEELFPPIGNGGPGPQAWNA